MKLLFAILIFCGSLSWTLGQSCEVDGILHSTFEDVKSILDKNNCNSCHANEEKLGGWNYNSYEDFLSSGDCGNVMILNGDASNSYFYRKLGGGGNICGESDDNIHNFSLEEFAEIESWINFGAPEFCVPIYSEVRNILNDNNCNSCHGNDPERWRYDSYASMFNNDVVGSCVESDIITKGSSWNSFLYDKINNDDYVYCGEEMNSESGPMSYRDVASIRDWINSGAIETSASLPVILTRFEVKDENGVIQLSWSTESEVGTEKFVVERSRTGQDFQSISELTTEGNPSIGHDYATEDSKPLIGDNYYRLKIVDFDGSYHYSNIRLVRVKTGETIITVYPNPAVSRERLTVKWLPQADQETTYLNIVDVNGQNLHRKIIFEGTNYVRLPYLLDGVYYIMIEDLFGGFLLERVVIIN